MSTILDYEMLVASYEDRLLNQLRGHGVDLEFLELWVPDEDPVASILNMAEAAEAAGESELSVRIATALLAEDKAGALETALGEIGQVEIRSDGDMTIVHLQGMGA